MKRGHNFKSQDGKSSPHKYSSNNSNLRGFRFETIHCLAKEPEFIDVFNDSQSDSDFDYENEMELFEIDPLEPSITLNKLRNSFNSDSYEHFTLF